MQERWRLGGLGASLLLLGTSVLATPVLAQERQAYRVLFKGGDDFTAEVPATGVWCKRDVTLMVRGRSEETFAGAVSVRIRLGGGIQAILPRECPQVERVTVNGFVDDVFVYRAVTSRTDPNERWHLLELPVAAVHDAPDAPPPPASDEAALQEPSEEAVKACDMAAAHPDDPTKPADVAGVSDDEMHAGAALTACEEAVLFDPDNVRLLYQLARAYLIYDRPVEGVELMAEAAEEGHGAAIAVLGDIALYGLLGDDPDPELARSLYQQAAAAGFTPAATLANAIEDNPEVDTSASMTASTTDAPQLRQPTLLTPLLQGAALQGSQEEVARGFVYGIQVVGGVLTHCPESPDSNAAMAKVSSVLVGRTKMPRALIATVLGDEGLQQDGLDDGYALAFDKGCSSPEVASILRTVRLTADRGL